MVEVIVTVGDDIGGDGGPEDSVINAITYFFIQFIIHNGTNFYIVSEIPPLQTGPPDSTMYRYKIQDTIFGC